jgi:hypothetical protein
MGKETLAADAGTKFCSLTYLGLRENFVACYTEIYALAALPRETVSSTLNNRLGGLHNRSGRFGGENSLSPAEKRSIYQNFNFSRLPAIFALRAGLYLMI